MGEEIFRIGEVLSRRALNAKHFSNSDGSFTAEFHQTPIHYQDGNGVLQDCELDLIAERNWEFEYAVKKNNFKAYFSDSTDVKNFTLASFEIVNSQGKSRWINYKLFGAMPSGNLPEGNKITYFDCFPNVDLQYVVDTWHLKENIILKAPVENFSFTFSLKLDGARLEQQKDGSILFIDIDTNETLWKICTPYAFDSSDFLELNTTNNVRYILGKIVYNNIEYDSITVELNDTDFLNRAKYPVIIDPTTMTYSVAVATDNGYVMYEGPSTTYPPTGTPNAFSNIAPWPMRSWYGTDYRLHVGLIRFNTSGIPSTAVMQSANLKMKATGKTNIDTRNVVIEYFNFTTIAMDCYTATPSNNAHVGTPIANIDVGGTVDNILALQNLSNINRTGYTGFRLHIDGAIPTGNNYVLFGDYTGGKPAALDVTYNQQPGNPGAITAPTTGNVWNTTHTIQWGAATDPDTPQASLQYEITLSIDGGSTYPYTIVALTTAGAISYVYDFTSIPASANCYIRIRAWDGSSFGGWALSNKFTIQHNQPPTAPTGLTRSNFDATAAANFTWTFNDPDAGNTQSAYQLVITKVSDGSTVKDTGKVTSATSLYTLPAGTLTNGIQYQWKVACWDNSDAGGPYSTLATFYTSGKPSATITTPTADGATIASSGLIVTWSFSDPESEGQSAYQLKLTDNADVLLWDSGQIMDNVATSRALSYTLLNNASYKVKLTVWDAKGVAGNEVVRTFVTSFTPPAVPTLTHVDDNTRGSITINITNPAPSGNQPSINYNDVYRRKQSETSFIRIATNIPNNGSFIDYTPASGQVYEYKVTANGNNGTSSDSTILSSLITVPYTQLSMVSSYIQWITLMYYAPRQEKRQVERAMTQYAGRPSRVAEYGEHTDLDLGLSFSIRKSSDVDTLRTFCESRQILLYRDNRGRREFVTTDGADIQDQNPNYWIVSINFQRTSYAEAV